MQPLPRVSDLVAQLRDRNIQLPSERVRVDSYGDSAELSASLLALIKAGRKRAGTSLLWAIEADFEPLPQIDDIGIVIDHESEPAIVTRTMSVHVVPFIEVKAEYAAIEGEGDLSLTYWRDAHWAFFTRECARIGRTPSETMPVVCCVFEVLHVLSPKGAASRRIAIGGDDEPSQTR
jgi:uncharacterized protein YhfF